MWNRTPPTPKRGNRVVKVLIVAVEMEIATTANNWEFATGVGNVLTQTGLLENFTFGGGLWVRQFWSFDLQELYVIWNTLRKKINWSIFGSRISNVLYT